MHRLALAASLFATACSCPTGQDGPVTETQVTRPTPPPPPPVPVERIRGLVHAEGEHLYLTVCGSEQPSKVLGSAVGQLREALETLEVGPEDPPVNVEVIGATRDQPGGGGMVAVETLQVAVPPGSTALCELDASYQYRASGTEPFWSLSVIGGTLRFEAMDLEAPVEVSATAARVPGSAAMVWRGEGGGRSLELQLLPERCHDGMSGASYPFAAIVLLDGAELGGCGMQGWDAGE
jgi:uncharacterized membrane protein